MEIKPKNMWWVKSKPATTEPEPEKSVYIGTDNNVSSNSLVDLFEKEAETLREKGETNVDVDVGSIIEEINRVAAQSPLGPFDSKVGSRSVDELMKEAERIYMESSKSFEQLSQRSKTSQNISDISFSSKDSTPTPKSVSPLPLDPQTHTDLSGDDNKNPHEVDAYSDDFSDEDKSTSTDATPSIENVITVPSKFSGSIKHSFSERNISKSGDTTQKISPQRILIDDDNESLNITSNRLVQSKSETQFNVDERNIERQLEFEAKRRDIEEKQMALKNDLIKDLEEDNERLKNEIENMKIEVQRTQKTLQELQFSTKQKSPDLSHDLEKALDELKDTQEVNTALQLQLDSLTQTHLHLRSSQEDLLNQNKNLERHLTDVDNSLAKYKHELLNAQRHRDKLLEVEISLNKLLDIEKLQTKSLKSQNESDAKCIQDLNRQIKEMERIIARKHPDSVSALIMAARSDDTSSNLTARKLLEDRIKTLETELQSKEKQSSQVFIDIQDKFNQMKAKYENHIEDLELHVSDLKTQLKKKKDCFDMYTQTTASLQNLNEIPQKESKTIGVQTDATPLKPPKVIAVKTNTKVTNGKTESHLLATIRGLQSDLSNKEKIIMKMQREIDELKRTNRRLQKEREGSLKSLNERKDYRSYSDKMSARIKSASTDSTTEDGSKDETESDKSVSDKVKQRLYRIEMDYQTLKSKRLHDLNALQEAHEREIAQYIQNLQPLREKMEIQQISITNLQSQLACAKEELAIVTVERDHLNEQLSTIDNTEFCDKNVSSDCNVESLQKKLVVMERRYDQREIRLRAIVTGLAQRSITNRNCEQCAERQEQLIQYKMELDQLLASIRALK